MAASPSSSSSSPEKEKEKEREKELRDIDIEIKPSGIVFIEGEWISPDTLRAMNMDIYLVSPGLSAIKSYDINIFFEDKRKGRIYVKGFKTNEEAREAVRRAYAKLYPLDEEIKEIEKSIGELVKDAYLNPKDFHKKAKFAIKLFDILRKYHSGDYANEARLAMGTSILQYISAFTIDDMVKIALNGGVWLNYDSTSADIFFSDKDKDGIDDEEDDEDDILPELEEGLTPHERHERHEGLIPGPLSCQQRVGMSWMTELPGVLIPEEHVAKSVDLDQFHEVHEAEPVDLDQFHEIHEVAPVVMEDVD